MCPCGSAKPYEQCCGPFHRGGNPPTVELLMRARYCAFARKDRDFLLRTWHAQTRPNSLTFDDAITWTGLEIIKTVKGQQPDSMGMVHFRAHYLTPQGPGIQEERSRFIRTEDGSPWVYVD
ncbi:YchJ family protein [Actinomyces sp. S4-C9]|uniref:YchJ family protein n=1 Tax=Actinomyces sp. S4-C9 TaxID=1219581 RepID=UPI0009FD99E1|nr:YchJ family metal-binding protein [Actinomyces sp. S4-C9]